MLSAAVPQSGNYDPALPIGRPTPAGRHTRRPPDLQTRYSMSTPFNRGGYMVATNGVICVRRPAAPGTADSERAPDILSLDWKPGGPAVDMPAGESVMGPCDNCCGTGKCVCPDCDNDHECGQCDGAGDIITHKALPVGGTGVCISSKYTAILRSAGISQIHPPSGGHKPFYAADGDVEILVMRMVPNKDSDK